MRGPGQKPLRQIVSRSQWELICLLALGYTEVQIAFRLGRRLGGVRMAFRRIYDRTGEENKLQLANRWARERVALRALPDRLPQSAHPA